MSFRFSQLLRLFEREMRMMNQMMEPEFAFGNRRYHNNRRYNLAAEEQEQTKSIDQMAAPKEGEGKQNTSGQSTTGKNRQDNTESNRQDTSSKQNTSSRNDTSTRQDNSSRNDTSSRQDASKQLGQSSDSSKSNTQSSESSEKNVRGSRRQQGSDHTPRYYSYSYSKSYRTHNGESFSTERYSVDTPNLQFTAEKPENADQFQIEYNKTGEGEGEQSNKDNKVQRELSADVEDDLHRWMSRINTELNYYESDFWHTPYSRRWSPFRSLEREFDRDLHSLFGDLESDHGSRRRLEDSTNSSRHKKSLKGGNSQERSNEQGREHERESNEESSKDGQSGQSHSKN